MLRQLLLFSLEFLVSAKILNETCDSSSQPCQSPSVLDVRLKGYTGAGIVVGIVDVGVNLKNVEIKQQIVRNLSYNFVDSNLDVHEEEMKHGSLCGEIIAGCLHNMETCCNEGVAYNTKLAALKVFPKVISSAPIEKITKALTYNSDSIQIYSNAWTFVDPFFMVPKSLHRAIKHGIHQGRQGLGSIHVTSAGALASPLANDVHTITVSSVESSDKYACACTLTTASSNVTDGDHMQRTAIYKPKPRCETQLTGTASEAVSLVSAYIALALGANPRLTWRDVQHLIILSSDYLPLKKHKYFNKNGAGKRFNNYHGFGLLCVARLVSLAAIWPGLPSQSVVTVHPTEPSSYQNETLDPHCLMQQSQLTVQCNSTCIISVEQIEVKVYFHTLNERHSELVVMSPVGTESILMSMYQSDHVGSTRRHVTFTSVQFWGEISEGTWYIYLRQCHVPRHNIARKKRKIRILSVSMNIYGVEKTNVKSRWKPHRKRLKSRIQNRTQEPLDWSEQSASIIIIVICTTMLALILLFFVVFKLVLQKLYEGVRQKM